jgi:hypothetical protein
LPFSGLGAAKPVPRSYANASAATRSAATACSTVPRLKDLLSLGIINGQSQPRDDETDKQGKHGTRAQNNYTEETATEIDA